MKQYSERRILSFSAPQLFNLVADIRKYPEFLPWCLSASVEPIGHHQLKAELTVGHNFLKESYTSRVTLVPYQHIVTVQEKGPFKHLENRWEFTPLGESQCQVDFYLDFEFRSKVFNLLMGQVFEETAQQMIKAFESRAQSLYF